LSGEIPWVVRISPEHAVQASLRDFQQSPTSEPGCKRPLRSVSEIVKVGRQSCIGFASDVGFCNIGESPVFFGLSPQTVDAGTELERSRRHAMVYVGRLVTVYAHGITL
jgi:hypothetical protein